MENIIHKWVGKQVHVVLRSTMPTPLKGTLAAVVSAGILIDVASNGSHTFVPVTSILHITLVDGA